GHIPPDPARRLAPPALALRNTPPGHNPAADAGLPPATLRSHPTPSPRATTKSSLPENGPPILAPMGFRRYDAPGQGNLPSFVAPAKAGAQTTLPPARSAEPDTGFRRYDPTWW